jgi:hypothetical protein
VIVLGLAVGILGPAILLLTAVRATTRQYVFGTAHVYSASPPTVGRNGGRAELHLAVFADGIDGVAVRVLDPAVPVSKWPDDGATLPIEVVANNPRKVRVLWDQVVTHAQAAGEDLYPQHVEDLPADLDDDYDDLPPDDFLDGPDDLLDEERLPPPPPSPPPSMPSGPLANVEGAGADFAPVPAPMLVPAAAEPPVGTPPKVAAGPQVKPVSPAPRAGRGRAPGRGVRRRGGAGPRRRPGLDRPGRRSARVPRIDRCRYGAGRVRFGAARRRLLRRPGGVAAAAAPAWPAQSAPAPAEPAPAQVRRQPHR